MDFQSTQKVLCSFEYIRTKMWFLNFLETFFSYFFINILWSKLQDFLNRIYENFYKQIEFITFRKVFLNDQC